MNAVIFCEVPCDWLTPLMGIRKAELPLCGKPLLSYLLGLLLHSGVIERVWLADASPALLQAASAVNGLRMEQGAPPRSADTDTLVIGGGGLFDCDFAAALSYHQSQPAGVTFLTKEMPMQSHCALLRVTNGSVQGQGRAARGDIYADTGYAIVSAGCPITPVPLSLCERLSTRIYAENAVWEPLSSVASYLACQQTVLGGWLEAGGHKRLDGLYTPTTDSFPHAVIAPPVFLGHRVRIGAETTLSNTVIGNGVTIGSGVSLVGCTVQDGAYLGNGVQARDALICGNAMLMNGCRLEPGSAIGEGASIGERAVVEAQVRVFAGKRVLPRTTAELDVRYTAPVSLTLGEESICGELSPPSGVRLGSCLAQVADRVALGYAAGQPAAKALASAIAAGISGAGGTALLMPDTVLPALCFGASESHAGLLLHIDAEDGIRLRLYAAGGLPLTDRQEELLERALDCRTVARRPYGEFGAITELDALQSLYELRLLHAFSGLSHPPATVSTANTKLRQLGNRLFSQGVEEAGLLLQLSADGRQLSAYSDETGFVRQERLQLLCCLALTSAGQSVALPEHAPAAAEGLAAAHGCRVLRYHESAGDSAEERAARVLALEQRFSLDGLFAAGIVLRFLAEQQTSLVTVLKLLPSVHISRRLLPVNGVSRGVLRRLCGEKEADAQKNGTRLTLHPSRSGGSVAVYAEAADMETAAELVAEAERFLGR